MALGLRSWRSGCWLRGRVSDAANALALPPIAFPPALVERTAWALKRAAQRRSDVGPGEIVAHEQQRAVMGRSDLVREAIAEVESRLMHTLAPSHIGIGTPASRSCSDRHDFKWKLRDQCLDFFPDVPTQGNDQRLVHSARGDQKGLGLRNRGHAGASLRLAKRNDHQRRGIDDDHVGKPSPS